jgi:anti-sigma regulatory factor (Ser/Thr protein kinase)
LEQAILNLLSNAVKYNQPQGHVWVTARGTAGEVIVTVRDDGRGIAPGDLPYIFDRFYRVPGTKVEGTGLGLAIVRTLVELHGGQITVESAPGVGSAFTVTLPRGGHPPQHADGARELVSTADEGAENADITQAENADEVLDSVDDNLQEPPQMFDDADAPDAARQD